MSAVPMFCNPPARSNLPTGAWRAGQCRRWKETVSTFDTDRPSTQLQAIRAAQVDCRIPSQVHMTVVEQPQLPRGRLFPNLPPPEG